MHSIQTIADRNLSMAKIACCQTRGILRHGAPNRPWEWFTSGRFSGSETRNRWQKVRDLTNRDAPDVSKEKYGQRIDVNAKYAKQYGAGNCGEHAAIAFKTLERIGMRPLDYVAIMKNKVSMLGNRSTSTHAFVIVGRVAGSTLADSTTWGPDAVICDAWANEVYPASEVPKRRIGTDLRHLGLLFRIEDPRQGAIMKSAGTDGLQLR